MKTKRILTHISLVILMLVITTTGFSKEKFVESKWTAQSPKIDGLDEDWSEVVLTSEKKAKVDYAVRNDAQNMYVLFIFKDPKFLSTINATGITLYFNTQGKKKKNYGLHFIKKQVPPEELIAYLEKRGDVLTEQQRQSIKAKPAYIVYMAEWVGKKGKKASEATQIPGTWRAAFKINKKGNEVIYEFRVPLVKSEASPGGIGVEPGQNLKIGFEWGGMTEELRDRLKAQLGGEISRESGAGAVIDSRRGTTGALKTTRAMPKKHSFWVDVKLAQNQ